MKLSRNEIRLLFTKISAVLASDEEVNFKIIKALSVNKRNLKGFSEEISDVLLSLQKKESSLTLDRCEKDKEGKPVIKDNKYCGLEKGIDPEYDRQLSELLDEKIAYLKEEMEVPIQYINEEDIPKKGKAFIMDTLFTFVRGD